MEIDTDKKNSRKRMKVCSINTMAVFRSEIFGGNIPVVFSLLFGKIYPTMN
jgi:hypothetical protein